MKKFKVAVPNVFWEDHYDRCSNHDGERNVVRRVGKLVLVELDEVAFDDLLSDADLYATPKQFGSEYASLCRSAKATMRILREYHAARRIAALL